MRAEARTYQLVPTSPHEKNSKLLAFGAKVDTQLLTLFVEVAAFQAEGFCCVGDVTLVALEFCEERGALEGGYALG